MTSKGKDHEAMLKTVKHWEKDFGCEFECDKENSFVVWLRWKLRMKWETHINNTKNFCSTWVYFGSESIKKHAVQVHTNSTSYLAAKKMGIEAYMNRVLDKTLIGRSFKNMYKRSRVFELSLIQVIISQSRKDLFLILPSCWNSSQKMVWWISEKVTLPIEQLPNLLMS